jgi:hypothetical protein
MKRLGWHFTVGKGAQEALGKRPCDGGDPKVTIKRLPMNCRVLPLKIYDIKARDALQRKID